MPQPIFATATKPASKPAPQPAALKVVAPPVNVQPLEFTQCVQIFEHKLTSLCRGTHTIETVQRRCEKGFFVRSTAAPSMQKIVALAYSLRNLPAWRGVKFIVGIFFEGFADGMTPDHIESFMTRETPIQRLKWFVEGSDLFIAPRSRYEYEDPDHDIARILWDISRTLEKDTFSPEVMEKLELLAANLERDDRAIFSVYVEIQVPLTSNIQ